MLRWVSVLCWLLLGCGQSLGAQPQPPPPSKPQPEQPGWNDYSTPRVESLAAFVQLAALSPKPEERPVLSGVKFVITGFSESSQRKIHFLDGRFYQFHDEWAWFRLLNGQTVPGMQLEQTRPFAEPAAARSWARAHERELPHGLELNEGRLYAAAFYDLSLAKGRRPLAAGTLIHVEPQASRPEVWGFEIEYGDEADVAQLRVFFAELGAAIPETWQRQLRWIVRSPEQLEVGKRLMASDPQLAGRVMTYADVSVPGETAVYTAGLVAGRLRAFAELSHLGEAEPEDILLLGALPEYLPQARGLVTAIPQTPLAHLNLLAKGRQIVNAYRGGVLDDPDVKDLLRSRAPVVLSAENGRLRFHRISEQQYGTWQDLLRSSPPALPTIDVRAAPYLVELASVKPVELQGLAPLIGGKAVGMVQLLRGIGPGSRLNGSGTLRVDVPDRPLAVTIRAYREHLAPLLPELRALLVDENFLKFKRLRYLALEGPAEFERAFPNQRDRELAKSYASPRALGPIAQVVRRGGVVHMVRHAPLSAGVKAALAQLPTHFRDYSPEQGLRFRSSSTVEDIEGFSGAGLYDSSTGFLKPRRPSADEAKRPSVADALRKTWASYFSAEAFEERHQNHIDHLASDMAVLVHARFDDALEQANGVFTFTLAPGLRELAVDAQPGAVSVTNPPTDRVVIPESSRVRAAKQGSGLAIERQSPSSLSRAGQPVLSNAELGELFRLGLALTQSQLEQDNQGVPAAQQRRSLVMDFEFRRVAAGWPALQQGERPARLVIKQMRPLEPSPRVSAELKASPIPRDVLARARRIETRHCQGDGVELSAILVLTDPDALPDLGFSKQPLLAGLAVSAPAAAQQAALAPRVFTHLELRSVRVEDDALSASLLPGLPLSRVEISGPSALLVRSNGAQQRARIQCRTWLDHTEPRELLRSYIHGR